MDKSKYIKISEIANKLKNEHNEYINKKGLTIIFPNIEIIKITNNIDGFEYQGDREQIISSMIDTILLVKKGRKILNPYERCEYFIEKIKSQNNSHPILINSMKDYLFEKLNNSTCKDNMKSQIVNRHIKMLNYLIDFNSKDINQWKEEDFQNIFSSTTKYVLLKDMSYFFRYLKNKYIVYFQNDYRVKVGTKLKTDDDFYSLEEWSIYINNALDIDKHIVNAFNNIMYAKCWSYILFNLFLAWRSSDIYNIQGLSILVDFDKYDLEWFSNNEFTLNDAQYVIGNAKNVFEQQLVQKTKTNIHFNVPDAVKIPFAISLICLEKWRRILDEETLFGKSRFDTNNIPKLFGDEFSHFSNRKANRTLLSLMDDLATTLDVPQYTRITTYMRAHKTNSYNFSDTTSQYLQATYSDKELNEMTMQLYDRGMFGWLYDSMLSIANNDIDMTTKEKTNQIVAMKNNLPVEKLEELSNIVTSYSFNKEKVINELLHCDKNEIIEKVQGLYAGHYPSKNDDIYCFKDKNCPYKLNTNCIACEYSIPTTFILYSIFDEFNILFDKIQNNPPKYEYDKIRTIDKMFKLYSIVNEAINTFGESYVNGFFDCSLLKNKIKENYELIKEVDNYGINCKKN